MQLIRGLHNILRFEQQLSKGCVLTIGNFDGVHLGHQQVLNAVADRAKQLALPSVVMIFEPLPIEFFAPHKAPVRLMNLREKLQAFRLTNIDYVLCVHFTNSFAELSAQQFVEQVLVDKLQLRHLVVGDDFHFGKKRQGDFVFLQQKGQQYGFDVDDMPTFDSDGLRVSSTRIRAALGNESQTNASQGNIESSPAEIQTPDLTAVKALLGKPFSFDGRVIHGQKLGRTIGFPTLNLNPKRQQMPVQGVFAVTVEGIADKPWPGVANLGLRPTVDGIRPSIEVHLFDWNEDVYGKHVQVTLQAFIRNEMKFDGIESLKQQIKLDAEQAKQFF